MKNPSSHLDGLNPAQRAAVTFGIAGSEGARTEGAGSAPPLLVIAGAGTGKTKTLATRVAHLKWSGKFHAVGAKLLRLYAGSIGLDPAFSILDRSDSADLMDLARDELRLSPIAAPDAT